MDESQVMEYVKTHMDTIPFKTLRYGEVEPSLDDKLQVMQSTLHTDPGLFLSKWGRHLPQHTLRLFTAIKDNYEVNFYLNSLLFQDTPSPSHQQAFKKSSMHQLAQNRRYAFLQRDLRHSDYFSDENMQLRDPVLYEQFVGQHIPMHEKSKPYEKDVTLVDRIYSNMDRRYVVDHLEKQKVIDEEQFEEEEEEDDSEDEIMEKSTPAVMTKNKGKQVEKEEEEESEEASEEEEDDATIEERMLFREEQRQELIKLLEERFLAGKDDFDYDMVDYNEDYDDLKQQEQDIQDRYFDEDD